MSFLFIPRRSLKIPISVNFMEVSIQLLSGVYYFYDFVSILKCCFFLGRDDLLKVFSDFPNLQFSSAKRARRWFVYTLVTILTQSLGYGIGFSTLLFVCLCRDLCLILQSGFRANIFIRICVLYPVRDPRLSDIRTFFFSALFSALFFAPSSCSL